MALATFHGPVWRVEQGWDAVATGATAQTNTRRRPHLTECLAQVDERNLQEEPYTPRIRQAMRENVVQAGSAATRGLR